MTTTMNQALEMAQKLNVEILSENGEYKFRPEIRPSVHETVYIHASNAAIQTSKTGLEWRLSKEYKKQQYQVRESSIRFHTFPTISALCTWLANESHEKAIREGEEIAKEEAQKRADKEQDTVYVIRVAHSGMLFTRTYAEIMQYHATDSIQILHTANPTHKPTGEEIAADAKPGDTIEWMNCNGRLWESTFKRVESGRGVIAEMDGEEIGIRFDKIRGLKKSGSTPDPTNEQEETTVYPSENAYSSAQRRGQFREALASDKQPDQEEAHCQVCGRKIRAKSGLIAHHGYRRPGDGFQTSSCEGARYVPYEVSCERLREVARHVKEILERAEKAYAEFLENPPDIITVKERRSSWDREGKDVEYKRPEGFNKDNYYYGIPRTYETTYGNQKSLNERTISAIKSELASMQRRIEQWDKAHEDVPFC